MQKSGAGVSRNKEGPMLSGWQRFTAVERLPVCFMPWQLISVRDLSTGQGTI